MAITLAIVGTALLGAFLLRPSPAPSTAMPPKSTEVTTEAGPRPTATASSPSEPPSASARNPSASARSPSASGGPSSAPVHLSIPAIGVSKRLLRLGLQPDRTVEVPSPADADYPGWYRLGTAPGQIGSAVILGHVDSLTGPAVFYELRSLEKGNRVDVRLADGAVAHFTVERVTTYPNREFPAREVYASSGDRALNLVTCGGTYDKGRGGYQSNVVAYTRWTGTTPAT